MWHSLCEGLVLYMYMYKLVGVLVNLVHVHACLSTDRIKSFYRHRNIMFR